MRSPKLKRRHQGELWNGGKPWMIQVLKTDRDYRDFNIFIVSYFVVRAPDFLAVTLSVD